MSENRFSHNQYQKNIFTEAYEEFCKSIPAEVEENLKQIVASVSLLGGERVLDVCSPIVGCKKFLAHCFATRPLSLGEARWERKMRQNCFAASCHYAYRPSQLRKANDSHH